jgi:hypothetical protein
MLGDVLTAGFRVASIEWLRGDSRLAGSEKWLEAFQSLNDPHVRCLVINGSPRERH